jgi:hypothetical protein
MVDCIPGVRDDGKMITREQAIYKASRVSEIVAKIQDKTIYQLPMCDRINLVQELREIRRDLIEYRKENPNG